MFPAVPPHVILISPNRGALWFLHLQRPGSLSIFIESWAYLLQLFQSSMTRQIRLQIYARTVHTMTRHVYIEFWRRANSLYFFVVYAAVYMNVNINLYTLVENAVYMNVSAYDDTPCVHWVLARAEHFIYPFALYTLYMHVDIEVYTPVHKHVHSWMRI